MTTTVFGPLETVWLPGRPLGSGRAGRLCCGTPDRTRHAAESPFGRLPGRGDLVLDLGLAHGPLVYTVPQNVFDASRAPWRPSRGPKQRTRPPVHSESTANPTRAADGLALERIPQPALTYISRAGSGTVSAPSMRSRKGWLTPIPGVRPSFRISSLSSVACGSSSTRNVSQTWLPRRLSGRLLHPPGLRSLERSLSSVLPARLAFGSRFRGVLSFLPRTTEIDPPPRAFEGPGRDARYHAGCSKTTYRSCGTRMLSRAPGSSTVHGSPPRSQIKVRQMLQRLMDEILYQDDDLWHVDGRKVHDPRAMAWLEVAPDHRLGIARALSGAEHRPFGNRDDRPLRAGSGQAHVRAELAGSGRPCRCVLPRLGIDHRWQAVADSPGQSSDARRSCRCRPPSAGLQVSSSVCTCRSSGLSRRSSGLLILLRRGRTSANVTHFS